MLNFVPPTDMRKKRKEKEESELVGEDQEENLNKIVSDQYSIETRNALAQLSEKEVSFELIEV